MDLVNIDATRYTFPQRVDAILSTFALSLIPEAEDIIRRGSKTLSPGGRWIVLDLQIPDTWPRWLVTLVQPIVAPFGVVDEWTERRPWATIIKCSTRIAGECERRGTILQDDLHHQW